MNYGFKILTSLRNCNVASSPALRLGGASEQLSSLCFENSARGLTIHAHNHSGDCPRSKVSKGNGEAHAFCTLDALEVFTEPNFIPQSL